MFLNKLKAAEKSIFLKLAIHINYADDAKVDIKEKMMLKEISQELGIDLSRVEMTDFKLDDLVSKIESPISKRICVLELLRMGHVDGKKIDKSQRDVVVQIAKKLKVPPSLFKEMEKWVAEMSELYDSGTQLIKRGR